MPKANKPKVPKKRGPKEERLVIREDPQSALDKLLKKKPAKQPPFCSSFAECHMDTSADW